MVNKIEELLAGVESFEPKSAAEVEEFRIKILGKKGELNALMEEFKKVAPEQKRELGQKINALKNRATERINELKASLGSAKVKVDAIDDMTRPGAAVMDGSRHPISIVKNQIVEIFSRLGYTVAEGPEIEDDWHVFSALNFPLSHPARDMQDTFLRGEEVQRAKCEGSLVAYPHLIYSGACHGASEATYPHRMSRTCVPQRGYLVSCPLYLPSGRGFVHR